MKSKYIRGKNSWIILVLILLFGITGWSIDQTKKVKIKLIQSPNAELINWMILILRPKNIVYQYYPFSGKVIKREMEKNHFDCQAANAVLKVILCNDMMLNYHTGKVIVKNVPYIGPISPDGRYIISSGGDAIYDIKNKKTIAYYPKGPSDKLFTEGGVPYLKNTPIGRKSVPYHQLSDTDYLTFMYPTTPKPDGRFLAFRLSSPGGNRFTKYIYEYNLYDIIKKKGIGFNAKKRPEFGQELFTQWTLNYIGSGNYLLGKKRVDKSVTLWIKQREQIGLQKGSFMGYTSKDGQWALIYPKDKQGNYMPAIYNIKNKRIEISTLDPLDIISIKPIKIFWVWIGDPKKHPGFVDY